MTPFRYLVVPPPLCAYAIETVSPISDVVFHPLSAQCSKFLVTLSSGYVQLFDFGQNNIPANGIYICLFLKAIYLKNNTLVNVDIMIFFIQLILLKN